MPCKQFTYYLSLTTTYAPKHASFVPYVLPGLTVTNNMLNIAVSTPGSYPFYVYGLSSSNTNGYIPVSLTVSSPCQTENMSPVYPENTGPEFRGF